MLALSFVIGGCGSKDTDGDGEGDGGGDAFAELYAEDALPTFELTLSEDCERALRGDPYEYCAGDLTYLPDTTGGTPVTLSNVGIRLKGAASFRNLSRKAAFKVKLDEYAGGQRLLGLRRLTFNNMVQDPTMLHERLGYRYYRAAGVPAPLCNHARIYVNGEYFGLYANVQTLDDEFAEHLWDPAPGNLYDAPTGVYFLDLFPEYLDDFDLETNNDVADRSDLDALIEAVDGPDGSFEADADRMLDWTEWLTAAATQAIIADWDGYFAARNNYKFYHELERDRFLVFPWGIDQTFGITDSAAGEPLHYLDYTIDHGQSYRDRGRVFQRCEETPSCWERYLDTVEAALATFEALPLDAEVDAMIEQTEAARSEDERKEHGDETTDRYRAALRTFLAERPDHVRTDLADHGR